MNQLEKMKNDLETLILNNGNQEIIQELQRAIETAEKEERTVLVIEILEKLFDGRAYLQHLLINSSLEDERIRLLNESRDNRNQSQNVIIFYKLHIVNEAIKQLESISGNVFDIKFDSTIKPVMETRRV